MDEAGQRNFSKALAVAKQIFNSLTEYIQVTACHVSYIHILHRLPIDCDCTWAVSSALDQVLVKGWYNPYLDLAKWKLRCGSTHTDNIVDTLSVCVCVCVCECESFTFTLWVTSCISPLHSMCCRVRALGINRAWLTADYGMRSSVSYTCLPTCRWSYRR